MALRIACIMLFHDEFLTERHCIPFHSLKIYWNLNERISGTEKAACLSTRIISFFPEPDLFALL